MNNQTLTIQQAIDLAVRHHAAGELDKAKSLYQQVLQVNPNQPKALHLLGVIAHQVNKNDIAVDLIGKALALKPDYAEAYNNLSNVLQAQGKLDDAVASYRKAIVVKPDYAEAYYNLGNVLQAQGKLDDAVASYNKAVAIQPDYADAHNNLGNVLQAQGKLDDAVARYNKAIAVKPDYGDAHNNLGNVLQALGKLGDAVASYHKAITIEPDGADVHNNLGNVLQAQGKLDDAVASYNNAIAIKPDYADAHNNLGNVLQAQGKLDDAVASYNKAVAIQPDCVEAHYNLAFILRKLGRYEEALSSIDMSGSNEFRGQYLECLYALKKYEEFYLVLGKLIENSITDLRVAAISTFVSQQIGRENPYPFCRNPIDFIRSYENLFSEDGEDGFLQRLILELYRHEAIWEPNAKSTHKGFQSNTELFDKPTGLLLDLKRKIQEKIELYRSDSFTEDSEFIRSMPKILSLEGWFVRLSNGGHQTEHIHPSGWLSGVIYLQVPEMLNRDEGSIEFGLWGYDYPILDTNYPRKRHHPKNGQLILFPSSLFHKTIPFESDRERICVSFDLIPT